MKGANSTYRPSPGTLCLVSGPNCDDENGYTFIEATILWCDEVFVVYRHRNAGCWPNVSQWDYVICKPLS